MGRMAHRRRRDGWTQGSLIVGSMELVARRAPVYGDVAVAPVKSRNIISLPSFNTDYSVVHRLPPSTPMLYMGDARVFLEGETWTISLGALANLDVALDFNDCE